MPCHSGPESTRHFADVDVSKHDEVDTYEPAFRADIVAGKAGSIKNRDLGLVTEDGRPTIAEGDYAISVGGGQPDTGAPVVSRTLRIEGQIDLAE